MSVYPVTKETLAAFHAKLPPRENEPLYVYLARVEEANLARVIDRAAAKDPRTYREIVAEADKLRVPVLLREPPPPAVPTEGVLRLDRTSAKDPRAYRAASARAAELGLQLVIVD